MKFCLLVLKQYSIQKPYFRTHVPLYFVWGVVDTSKLRRDSGCASRVPSRHGCPFGTKTTFVRSMSEFSLTTVLNESAMMWVLRCNSSHPSREANVKRVFSRPGNLPDPNIDPECLSHLVSWLWS